MYAILCTYCRGTTHAQPIIGLNVIIVGFFIYLFSSPTDYMKQQWRQRDIQRCYSEQVNDMKGMGIDFDMSVKLINYCAYVIDNK